MPRQEHRAGEKMFVDYAGATIPIQDPQTGEIDPAGVRGSAGRQQLHLRGGPRRAGSAAAQAQVLQFFSLDEANQAIAELRVFQLLS